MPFVLEKDDNTLCVDFGQGRSITFRMREEAGNIQALRLLIQKEKRAKLAVARIEQLTEQAKNAKDNTQYQKLIQEIEQLASEPDDVSVVIDMILAGSQGWTDYYATKEAEAAGQVQEFNKANIEKLPINALGKISKAFTAHYGIGEEVPGEAKGNLQEQSQLTGDSASSPIGTSTSVTTAP